MAYRIQGHLTFIHIPKNAGTSIKSWLESNLDGQFEFDDFKHSSVNDIPPLWKNNMFCVIRNPWARALSWYKFLCKTMKKMSMRRDFKEFIKPQLQILNEGFESYVVNYMDYKFYKRPNVTWYSQYKPNCYYIDTSVKFLRYEHLDEDFVWVQKQTKCYNNLPELNVSGYNRKSWREFYSLKMKNIIQERCKEDIERFGYEF